MLIATSDVTTNDDESEYTAEDSQPIATSNPTRQAIESCAVVRSETEDQTSAVPPEAA